MEKVLGVWRALAQQRQILIGFLAGTTTMLLLTMLVFNNGAINGITHLLQAWPVILIFSSGKRDTQANPTNAPQAAS